MTHGSKPGSGSKSGFLGTLKDALVAASREDTGKPLKVVSPDAETPAPAAIALPAPASEDDRQADDVATTKLSREPAQSLSAAEAARVARGGGAHVTPPEAHIEADSPPTTRVVRGASAPRSEEAERTQIVRGRQQVKRGEFDCDPVVGWLVVVGGPGMGSYRPIFEGNNAMGRSPNQRIPLDFGDDAISSEEQAYIRYDSSDRSFLFVPNLAKTNVVSVNDKRPTGAVELTAMDVITVGRTQLVFVPFCGPDFDWSELAENTG
jgi:hypothetical protein